MPLINSIHDKNHVIGLYESQEQKIEEGLKYLRIGFEQKNEAILLILDELSIDKVRNAIINNWNIFQDELTKLEKSETITIRTSSEFYFTNRILNNESPVHQYLLFQIKQ